jgi:hypothetical protein
LVLPNTPAGGTGRTEGVIIYKNYYTSRSAAAHLTLTVPRSQKKKKKKKSRSRDELRE